METVVLSNRLPLRRARREAGEKALIALEAFTGVTALAGGLLLMVRPNGSLRPWWEWRHVDGRP